MELKPGYKKTEVGTIPKDWEVKKLNEIATLINGRAFKQEELLKTGKYKVLRVGNFFTNGNWYFSNLELQPQFYVQKDDLMYAWSASFGPKFWLEEKCIYHYHIWKVIPQNNTDKNFLFYLFDFDKAQLLNQTQGGTMFHLTKSGMDIRPFPLPTLAEQTAIANALSDTDSLIASLEKLIVKKQAIKQGAMQELLKPKEGWVVKKLGEVGEIVTGSTPSTNIQLYWNGLIPWITPTDINIDDKDIFTSERKITSFGLNSIRKLEANTLLVTCIASIGKNAILRCIGASNQQINAITPHLNYNVDFLYYLIESSKNYLKGKAGVTATMMISKKEFSLVKYYFPNLKEQIRIATILSDIDQDITTLQAKLQKLKQLKQAQMQVLLTGKIRLV